MARNNSTNAIYTIDNLFNDIFDNGAGDCVVFCGAGISFNSGMPLAMDFANYILKALSCSAENIEKITTSDLPFEVFMEALKEQVDISCLMNIFAKGSANKNHFLLANLAKKGLVNTVITTNFDSLIENAFEAEGLKKNSDYNIYYKDEHFEKIKWEKDLIHLIKIHGSIDETESIAIVMDKIASRSLAKSRQSIIKKVFSSGSHSNVLVLGYSCSDIFDISPQIQKINNKFKKVIFCDHIPKRALEETTGELVCEKKYKNPFRKFKSGVRLYVNTNSLVDYLFNVIGVQPQKYEELCGIDFRWQDAVNKWENKIRAKSKEAIKTHIVARLLIKSSRYIEAEREMSMSLYLSLQNGDEYFATHAFINLGICQYRMGNFRKAIELHRKALKLSIKLKQKKLEGYTWGNIGNVLYSAKKSKHALSFQKRALHIAKEYDFKNLLTNTLGNIGIIYLQLSELKKAKEYNEQALQVAEEIGDIISISRHNYNIGGVYNKQGQTDSGIKYYLRALDFAEKSAQKTIQTSCLTKLGLYYKSIKKYNRAINFFTMALSFMEETGETLNKRDCVAGLIETEALQAHKNNNLSDMENLPG